MTDDQGYGDIAAHGNPVISTPHLERLHAEGVRLNEDLDGPAENPFKAAYERQFGPPASRPSALGTFEPRTALRAGHPAFGALGLEGSRGPGWWRSET